MGEHSRCRCKAALGEGERMLIAALGISWGANDLRDDWVGEKAFCSFACLRDWAAELSVAHDGKVVA